MQNLADVSTQEANEQVTRELKTAGIPEFHIESPRNEVDSEVIGFMLFQEVAIGFQRAWRYWVARTSKPFPLAKILEFNAKWGNQARIWGFAGGRSGDEITADHMDGDFHRLQVWHIDTQEALGSFVSFAGQCYTKTQKLSKELLVSIAQNSKLVDGKFLLASGKRQET